MYANLFAGKPGPYTGECVEHLHLILVVGIEASKRDGQSPLLNMRLDIAIIDATFLVAQSDDVIRIFFTPIAKGA